MVQDPVQLGDLEVLHWRLHLSLENSTDAHQLRKAQEQERHENYARDFRTFRSHDSAARCLVFWAMHTAVVGTLSRLRSAVRRAANRVSESSESDLGTHQPLKRILVEVHFRFP